MRINDAPATTVVTFPGAAGPGMVTGIATARAVEPQGNPAAQTLLQREPAPPVPAPAEADRRGHVRRAQERRKQQVRVTIDTRIGPRRMARRRVEDDAPAAIDVEA